MNEYGGIELLVLANNTWNLVHAKRIKLEIVVMLVEKKDTGNTKGLIEKHIFK